jgi:DAACS family dicarboxylate/amino acid:cation (Na+ or H+) symporter
MKLQTRILVGLVGGVLIGIVARISDMGALQRVVRVAEPLGIMFIRLLTMTIVPLIVASLFVGVASLGDVRRLGRIGGKTLAWFAGSTLIAATIGLTAALAAGLGTGLDAATRDSLTTQFEQHGTAAGQMIAPTLTQTLLAMIPSNPFAAAAQGELLPLIVAVCIFGAAATALQSDGKRAVVAFFSGVNELSMVVIRWLMKLAPGAVFVLIAATVAKSGLDLLRSLALYCAVVLAATAAHVLITLLPALRAGARLGVMDFLRKTGDVLMLAFSTASSSVALPVSIEAARDRLGISNEVASFVLPTGVTLNKNGAAVYKAVTAVFIANLYGIALGPGTLLTIVLVSTVAAFSGAGVPGSSLVTTLIVLNAIGLGAHSEAAIALVVAVDRPLDMVRSMVNTLANLIGAAWISRSESDAWKSQSESAAWKSQSESAARLVQSERPT